MTEINWKKNHYEKTIHTFHIILMIGFLFIIMWEVMFYVFFAGFSLFISSLFVFDLWKGIDYLCSNSKLKTRYLLLMNIMVHIFFVLVIVLLYLNGFDVFFLFLGSLGIIGSMIIFAIGLSAPNWIGISKKGIYFTDKEGERVEKKDIDKEDYEGAFSNIDDLKSDNFIPWSDIDGIKVENPGRIFGKDCRIYLRNGLKIRMNNVSGDIIKEMKTRLEEKLDEEE